MRVVGIDQGTTSTRAMVVGSDHAPQLVCRLEHRQIYPRPGWVEHDPNEVLACVRTAIDAAGPVDAIAIANQGESCLAWDAETGEPITPIIVWQDQRGRDTIDRLAREGAEQATLSRAGLPLDPYFAASKLAWIMTAVPAARRLASAGTLRLGTTDAFLIERLTGRFVTDVVTASRTSLMHLAGGAWDPELCRHFGIPLEALPQILPTIADFGRIGGVPIVASLVDQQAALWGHGHREPGALKITFGTGAFALAITGVTPPCPPRGIVPTVAWQLGDVRTYAIDAGIHDAGSALRWIARVGIADADADADDDDARSPAIDRDLVFVPALTGLACPHWDRRAGGMWLGLSLDTDRIDLRLAVLEGIALAMTEAVHAMSVVTPVRGPVAVDGGLSRNRHFVEVLASALSLPVQVAALHEMTAFGAAALALHAIGDPLPTEAIATHIVHPRFDASEWSARFADAVRRSRGWRH